MFRIIMRRSCSYLLVSHLHMSSEYRLTQEIIAQSQATTWDRVRIEWVLESVFYEDEPDRCLCGHFPINEICILRNRINGNMVMVGNVCVKKFMGLPSDKIFQAVKRVRKDSEKSLNSEAITYALSKSWINKWEHDFYLDIFRRRNLTGKQRVKKKPSEQKIINGNHKCSKFKVEHQFIKYS
jgi:hypothetical protein